MENNYQPTHQDPSEVSSSFTRPTEGLGVPVTFKLPRPTPEDEGLYEMQLFIDFDVNLLNCSDYTEFLQTPDGLELHEIPLAHSH